MDSWVIWLIAAVIFAIGEMATTSFFLAPFAGGAAVATLLAAAGAGGVIEWAAFLVVSILLPAALRPVARDHQRSKSKIQTGTAGPGGATAARVGRNGKGGG